jgi:hypothetical protein
MLVLGTARSEDRRRRAAVGHRFFQTGKFVRPAADHPGDTLGPRLGVGPDIVDHQPQEPVAILGSIGHRDDAAHRGADQHELVEFEPLGELRQVLRLILIAIGAGRGPGALPVPAHIEREDVKPILEVPGERVERVGASRVAVDAHDWRGVGLAPFEVVQGEIVDP